MTNRRDLFVLGRLKGTDETAMTLDLQPTDASGAKQLAGWQRKGAPDCEWFICTRTGPSSFLTEDGKPLEAHQAPYSDAPWERFLKTWEA